MNLYTIGEANNLLIGWRNNHDFNDANAPQVGEIFLQLFTEPWMAQQYIDEGLRRDDVHLYKIDSQDSWDYYRDLAIGAMDCNRAILNKCDLTKKHEEDFLFNIIPFNSYTDFEKLINSIKSGTHLCLDCYDKERFVKNFNPNREVKVFGVGFSE